MIRSRELARTKQFKLCGQPQAEVRDEFVRWIINYSLRSSEITTMTRSLFYHYTHAVACLIVLCCVFSTAHAQTETWDGGGADNNWMTDANWADNTAPAAGADLVFAGSVKDNPCNNNYTAGTSFSSITFSSTAGSFNLTGNSITLTGNITNNDGSRQTIALPIIIGSTHTINTANGPITFSGNISGSGSIIKAGTIDLLLSGTNTYAGSTTITAGMLHYNADTVFSGTGPIVLNGGILYHQSASNLANNLSVTASSTIESNDGDDITFSSTTISGDVGTTLSMTRTSVVTSPHDLIFSGIGITYAGNINLDAGSRLVFNNTSGSQTFSGVIGGTGDSTNGAVQRLGAGGTTTMSGTSTYTSPTDVAGGTLLITGTTHASSAVTVRSGAILGGGGTGTITGSVTLSAGATIAPGNGGTAISNLNTGAVTCNATSIYSVDISGTTSDRIISSGTFACAGTLTIASVTSPTLNQSYIIASGSSVTGTFAGLAEGALFAQQGRIFRVNYTATQVTLTDVTNARIWDGGGTDDNWMTADNWVGNVAPVANDDLLFTGITRPAPNNNFTSTNFGSIYFDSTAGNFDLTGNQITYSGSIVNNSSGAQKITLPILMNATRTVEVTAGTLEITGVISGTGGVTKTGAGTLIVTGTKTYTGDTTITAGRLQYGVDDVIDSGVFVSTSRIVLNGGTLYYLGISTLANPLRVSGDSIIESDDGQQIIFTSNTIDWTGGTLSLIASTTTREVTFSGSGFTYAGPIFIDSKSRMTFENSSGTQTFSGNISGTGGGTSAVLRNVGGGTTTLSGTNNTFTNTAAVTGGTLFVTGSIASNVTVGSADTLGGNGTIVGTVALNAGSTIVPGTGGTTIGTLSTGAVTCNASATYSVNIDGTTNDLVASTGAFACNGTLTIASVANPISGQVYTIASGTPVTGTFTGKANGAIFTEQSRNFLIQYTSTTVTLTDVTTLSNVKMWDGGGGDNNWNTGANWVGDVAPIAGDDLVFAGSTRLAPDNNYGANTSFRSITFASNAGNFVLGSTGANTIELSGGSAAIRSSTTSGTITLNLPITFSTAAPTITTTSGGTVLFGGTSTSILNNGGLLLTVSNGGNVTLGNGGLGKYTGSGGLTKSGAGTLTLSAPANDFTGTLTISAGTMTLGNGFVIPSTVSVVLNGTLDLAGRTTFCAGFSGSGILTTVSSGTLSMGQNGGGGTFSGTITGAVNFTKAGTATATLSGVNTHTGITDIQLGSLSVNTLANLSSSSALGAPTTTANGTILIGSANRNDFPGTLIYTGTGHTTDRVIQLNATDGGSAAITNNGTGLLQFTSACTAANTTSSTTKLFTLQGTNLIGGEIGAIVDSGGVGAPTAVTKAGSGLWTLTGANTYTGATTVSAGTLLVTGSTHASSAVSVASGAILGGTGTINGATTVAAGGTLAPGTGGTTQGILNTANVSFSGAGTLSLNLVDATPNAERINTTGTFNCSNATLSIVGVSGALPNTVYTIVNATTVSNTFNGLADGAYFFAAGRVFIIDYTPTAITLEDVNFPTTTKVWDGGGADGNWMNDLNWLGDDAPDTGDDLVFAGTTNLTTVNNYPANTSFRSITFPTNAGNFALTGTNTLVLSGGSAAITSLTTSGTMTLNLPITFPADSTITTTSGGTVLFGGISTSELNNGGFLLTINNGGNVTLGNGGAGRCTGSGGLTKTGAGTLTLSANTNNFSGVLTISAGTLTLGNGYVIPNAVTVVLNGTLDLAGRTTFCAGFSGSGILTSVSSGTLNMGQNAGGGTFSGTITGAVSFIKGSYGAGVNGTTLSGMNTYTGGTTIAGGEVSVNTLANLSSPSALGAPTTTANGTILIGSGNRTFQPGTLIYTGTGHTTDRVIQLNATDGGSAAINHNGSGLLQFTNACTATNTTSATTKLFILQGNSTAGGEIGAIVDSGGVGAPTAVTKSGSGLWTLTGPNTYTGATTVSAGTLLITGSTHASSAVTVASGAILGGTGTINGTVALNAGSFVAPGTGGTPISTLATGAVTMNGTTTYRVDLNGTGASNDRIAVTGNVTCAGTLTITSYSNPRGGQTFTIVSCSSGTRSGTFSGLSEGATIPFGGRTLRINYTSSSAVLTDIAAPLLTSRQTVDLDGDGQIDRIRLTFDQTLNDNITGLTVAVTGYTVASYDVGSPTTPNNNSNDDVLDVVLTESGTPDTNATPSVRITGNTGLAGSVAGNAVAIEGSPTNATDAAAPVLISATWNDVGGSLTATANDTVVLVFSESVTRTATPITAFSLPVTDDSWGSTADPANGPGNSITLTLAGSFVLTPGGTYSSGALGAGRASGVFISNGSTMVDAVSLAVATGSIGTARDLISTRNLIGITWSDDSTTAKSWALGSTVSLSEPRNTVTDNISLSIKNADDRSVRLMIKTSDSTSAWTPDTSAGVNKFLLKAHNGIPASATTASNYDLTLTTSDQTLRNVLYSGQTTPLNLYFQAPTSITVGGGTPQTITVTITAQIPP
jgi:fibronectin-binding autotransporter adhesin